MMSSNAPFSIMLIQNADFSIELRAAELPVIMQTRARRERRAVRVRADLDFPTCRWVISIFSVQIRHLCKKVQTRAQILLIASNW